MIFSIDRVTIVSAATMTISTVLSGVYVNALSDHLKGTSLSSALISMKYWNALVPVAVAVAAFQVVSIERFRVVAQERRRAVIEKLLEASCRALAYPRSNVHLRAFVSVMDDTRTQRRVIYAYNAAIDPEKTGTFDSGFGVTGEAISKRIPVARPLESNHLKTYDRKHQRVVAPELRSVLAAPVLSRKHPDDVIAVLAFDSFDEMTVSQLDSKEAKEIAQLNASMLAERLDC